MQKKRSENNKMNYTKEIFQRATIKGLAEYLLYGAPATKETNEYEERMENAFHQFDKQIQKYDNEKAEELSDFVNQLVNETTDVYTEIGLQAGFLIMIDMIKNIGFSIDVKKEQAPRIDFSKMYDFLVQDVSIALQLLQENKEDSIKKAELILKNAQCIAKEIYISDAG